MVFIMIPPLTFSQEILIDDYRKGISARWEKKSFTGNTRYETVTEDSQLCIKATSNSSASGLYYKIEYGCRRQWWDHILNNPFFIEL